MTEKTITDPRRLPIVGPDRERALQALSADAFDDFPGFIKAVSQRLEKGRDTYGGTSFDKPIRELLGEIEQECLDLAGWGFILWSKLQSTKSLHDTQYKLLDAANNHDRRCTDEETPYQSKPECGAKIGHEAAVDAVNLEHPTRGSV